VADWRAADAVPVAHEMILHARRPVRTTVTHCLPTSLALLYLF